MLEDLKKKKSLLVIRNLVVAELVLYLAFLGIALSADWAEFYAKLPKSNFISFTIFEFASLAIIQIVLIVVIVTRTVREENDINEIVKTGEHERLEFKTSLRWDPQKNQVNKELERSVMKTITAFLNSDGGNLVIGLTDNKKVFGLELDKASLARNSDDGFENHFNNLFVAMIGPEFRQHAKLSFHRVDDKKVSLVEVSRAHRPAYLKTEKGEDFFIRTGNATTPLKVSQVAPYISSRWANK